MPFLKHSRNSFYLLLLILSCPSISVQAQITGTLSSSATALATAIAGPGVTVSGAVLNCGNQMSGTFTAPAAAIGLTDGIMLSTGHATNPNANQSSLTCIGTDYGRPGYAPLNPIAGAPTQDACRLEFDVVPTTTQLQFRYVFGSDEYDEYVGSAFNDAFGFFISGPGIMGSENIGVLPGGGVPVTINTVNSGSNAGFYRPGRAAATGYDGTTTVLVATKKVEPCKKYHLVLAIADANDGCWDSNVWIEKSSLVSVGVSMNNPTVTGPLGSGRIYENCDSATFTFKLNQKLSNAFGFKIKIKGTAVNGTDYRFITDTLVVPAGDTSVTVRVVPLLDSIADPGETVTICVLDLCTGAEVACQSITIEELKSTITPDQIICKKDSAQLAATYDPNYSYSWSPPTGLSCSSCYNPKASPPDSVTYTVKISDNGCSITKKVKVDYYRFSAGKDSAFSFCDSDGSQDLFSRIGGNPPAGGTWKDPTGANFVNPYNPATHSSGNYLYILSLYNCPPDTAVVSVTEVRAPKAGKDGTATVCNDNKAFNLFNLLGTPYDAGGTWSGSPGTLNAATGILDLTTITTAGTYTYTYTVKATSPCVDARARVTLTVNIMPNAGTSKVIPKVCQSQKTINLFQNLGGSPQQGGTWTDDNGSGGLNGATGVLDVSNIKGTYNYTYTVKGVAPCPPKSATVTVSVYDAPVAAVTNVVCNNINTGYYVHITFSGGDSNTYKVNNVPFSGTQYVSSLVTSGQPYSFTITDAQGCSPVSTVTGIYSCDCTTDAGRMDTTTIGVCGGTPAVASHVVPETLDNNDVRVYILHNGPGTTAGNIYAVNKNSPTFIYNPAWGINYNQRYYISSYAGDNDGSGMVDPKNANGCNDVAAGQPVIFREIPDAAASLDKNQVCRGESVDIIFTYSAGQEPYDFEYSYKSNTSSIAARTSVNNTWLLNPQDLGPNTYTVTKVTDAYGCSQVLNIPLTVVVVDKPDTANVRVQCNSINTAYTVSFDILNGDQASYRVNNQSTPSTYQSQYSASGSTASFSVSDKNNCPPLQFDITHTCPCVTQAGTMTVGPSGAVSDFCIYTPATATHNSDQVFDGNDVLSFILCSDPSDPIGTLHKYSSKPSFVYDDSLMTNYIYYICPVAGDDNGYGMVNLASACIDTEPGSPVRFIDLPTVSFTGTPEICEGQPVNFNFTITGNGAVRFTLRGDDGTSQAIAAPAGTMSQSIMAQRQNGTVIFTIDTAAPAGVYDSTTPSACRGSWTSSEVTTIINPTPTAAIVSPNDFTLCNGESIDLNFQATGRGNISVAYRDTAGNIPFSFTTPQAFQYRQLASPPAPGIHLYQITAVSSTSPAGITCPGTFSGSARIDMRPVPTGDLTADKSDLCNGDAVTLTFTQPGAYYPYRFKYKEGSATAPAALVVTGPSTQLTRTPSSTIVYTLDSVYDGSISSATGQNCTAAIGKSVTVAVHQLPVAEISGDKEICFGDTATVVIDFTGSDPGSAAYTAVFTDQKGQGTEDSVVTTGWTAQRTVSPPDSARYVLVRVYDQFGCEAKIMTGAANIYVSQLPVPIIAASDSSNCTPLITMLENRTDPKDVAGYVWHFGDNTTQSGSGMGTAPDKIYDIPGLYTVRLEITSPQGCYKDTVIPNFLEVFARPDAEFDWTPFPVTFTNSLVTFRDKSFEGEDYFWQIFDNKGNLLHADTLEYPQYAFPNMDTASYPVKLIVTSAHGCIDSIVRLVFVEGELIVYTPNSFTPNGDGVNDVFIPAVYGYDLESFEMWIFDRWGENLYYTNDIKRGWDGMIKGAPAKLDVYTFRFRVRSNYDADKREFAGKIQLVR